MNLLDFQILSSPSVNHRYSENKPNFGYFAHMAGYNASNDSTNTSSEIIMPSNPATNTQKSQEKKLQRGIYKGPDVFGTVLGPTADESILVAIQALMDMASTLEFCVFTPGPSTHDTPVDSPSKESPEVSEPVSQISASCLHVTDPQENTAFSAQPSMKSRSQSAQSVSPPQSPPRQLSPTESLIASPNRPCTQFFHQMTRISVLKNSLEDAPTYLPCSQKRTNCKLLKQPTLIFPDTVNDSVDVSSTAIQEKVSVGSETTKETTSKPIQTLPFRKRKLKHANVETNSVISQEKTSIACGCNFCAPIFGKVSQTPSRMSNVCKIISDIRLSGQMEMEKTFSACYCSPIEIAVLPVVDEKLCTCSLMPEGVRLADAAISCLKVNTSCQYDTSEIAAFESRSTQCGELNDKRESCSQLCSESGDYPPRGKNSFRILGGPYECPDFSETRYSMDPGDNGSVIPLLDCNDDPSKFCFENPAMVCMEMGDFCGSPPIEVRYAITKITKFRDFSTFEVMKSTSKKPKSMPKTVEGVFVLKKEENYCSSNSKTYE